MGITAIALLPVLAAFGAVLGALTFLAYAARILTEDLERIERLQQPNRPSPSPAPRERAKLHA